MNYPMIIITPCIQYCKNAQFSNRMTGHYSPESMICHFYMTFHSYEMSSFHALFIAHDMKCPKKMSKENVIAFPFRFPNALVVSRLSRSPFQVSN